MLYKFHNQFVNLDVHHLSRIIDEEEKRHRNGTFKYRPLTLSQEQVASLKQSWPPDKLKALGAKAKEIQEEAVERRAYLALNAMLMTEVCEPESPACKFAAIDLAFSMLTNTIPGIRFEPKNNFVERVFQGKRYKLRPSSRFARMLVPENEVKSADIYVFGIHVPVIRQCWMLGWASQEDMINGKRGNWNIDHSLSWNEMSYYKGVEELRPISELVRQMNLPVVPDGTIFEVIPNPSAIPTNDSIKDIEALLDVQIKTPLTTIPGLDDDPKPQPKQEPQAASPDDYTF